MPYLHLAFAIHIFVLLYANFGTSRLMFSTPVPRVLATAVLCWANLIHTYLLASTVHWLGSPLKCFALSVVVLIVHRYFCKLCSPAGPVSDGLDWRELVHKFRQDLVAISLLAALVLVTVCVVLVGLAVLPNNWDTLAYRFSRAFFYVSSGALVHAGKSIDPRINFYPFNGSILYLFLAQYQIAGISWNFVGILAWLGSALSVFYFPLALGGSIRAAMTSAFLVATTPIVLCSATSTNDDLLAGAPLVCGALFLVLWYRLRSTAALAIGKTALAISAAVKLHWMFLGVFFVVGIAVAIWNYRTELLTVIRETVRPAVAVAVTAFVLPLAGGFIVANYVSAGALTEKAFNASLLNSPFRTDVAAQTLRLYSAQLFLTPIYDHALLGGRAKGSQVMRAANETTRPLLFQNVVQQVPFMHPSYQFKGLYPDDSEYYYEQTVWLGLVPYLSLLAMAWILIARPPGPPVGWALVFSFLFFHITISCMLRYLETVGVYYAYVAPLAFAPLGLVWDGMRQSSRMFWRLLSKAFVVVIVSNTLLAGVLFFESGKRNVMMAWTIGDGETPVSKTEPALREVMATAKKVYMPYTHWELLFWNIMRLNPRAQYFTGEYRPKENFDLILYSVPAFFDWGRPMPVRGDRMGHFKLLGPLSSGESVLVCGGSTCRSACPYCDDYFSLQLRREIAKGKVTLFSVAPPDGIDLRQTAFLRFTVFNKSTRQSASSAWIPLAQVGTFRQTFEGDGFDHVLVETSCESGPQCRISRTVYPLAVGQRPLLDTQPDFDPTLEQARIDEIFGPGWQGTEGSGYWKFEWKLRPGTNILDGTFKGGGGESTVDELRITSITATGVTLLRRGTNGYFRGSWLPAKTPIAKGDCTWDPRNVWSGQRKEAARN